MKAAFFDFTIAFGGAPAGTISLAERLAKEMDVHFFDAYGRCEEYIEAVRRAGLPLHVLCPDAKKIFIGNSGQPFRRFLAVLFQARELLTVRKRLLGVLNDIRPDLVWVNNQKSLVFMLGPGFRSPIPVVLYYRGWGTADQIGAFFRFVLRRRTDGIIVHSPLIAQRFTSFGVEEEKIFSTPNAVGLTAPKDELLKSPLELPGQDCKLKILLPAARPVRDKGHDTAVNALKRLKDSGEDAVLWITGTVPTGVEHGYFEDVKAEIARLGLDQDVHFLGWRNDLQAVISRSDVVIVPSRTEGFPRVVVEAMLLGVPVCATPVGGVPDAVIDGRTGFLVDVGNDAMLADRIMLLRSDPDLRAGMAAAAKALAEDMFSLDKQTVAVAEVFSKVVKARKGQHV
jgi:glycosyltransferase involved in cell wall biosynthesis